VVTAIEDQPGPTPEEYMRDNDLAFPVAVDDDAGTIARALGIQGYPTLYFVSSDGTVAQVAWARWRRRTSARSWVLSPDPERGLEEGGARGRVLSPTPRCEREGRFLSWRLRPYWWPVTEPRRRCGRAVNSSVLDRPQGDRERGAPHATGDPALVRGPCPTRGLGQPRGLGLWSRSAIRYRARVGSPFSICVPFALLARPYGCRGQGR
jgi:hypothetical protein